MKIRSIFLMLERSQKALLLLFIAALGLIELLLADRKYGLFSGGFGQSQAVDEVAERFIFFAAYLSSLSFALISAFWIILRISRAKTSWVPGFNLVLFAGGVFISLLALQYQLHSYFSDAVSFQLMANLGGGSLLDAIMFAANEVAVGLAALVVAVLSGWIIFRFLRKHYPPSLGGAMPPYLGRSAIGFFILCLFFLVQIPGWSADSYNGLNRTLAWKSLSSAANKLTDFDGDGYGMVARMADDAPFDSSRHPLALDIPGNGIDEDGFGGDLALIPLPTAPPSQVITGDKPNLIIIVMESVRYDVLGKRVNGQVVAPNLEAIAAEGSSTVPAFSHIGFTTASLKSLFTGDFRPGNESPSLFRDLKQSGYQIGVFSGQPEDFGDISKTVGMEENADIFVDGTVLKDLRAFSNGAQGSILIDEGYILDAYAKNFSDPEKWQRPQFLYFNFQSPHFPYAHDKIPASLVPRMLPRSEIRAKNAEALRETYWNAVAYADKRLGELVSDLKEKKLWENTIVVVTGDHGEDLFEKGFLGHGHIINKRQYGTFFVTNKADVDIAGPIGLRDYRQMILSLMDDKPVKSEGGPVLMIVGELDEPTQIGMAQSGDRITTLRLDTGEACLVEKGLCNDIARLKGDAKSRADLLVRLWGSQRWQSRAVKAPSPYQR